MSGFVAWRVLEVRSAIAAMGGNSEGDGVAEECPPTFEYSEEKSNCVSKKNKKPPPV